MSEAIDRVREFVDAWNIKDKRFTLETAPLSVVDRHVLTLADLRELLAGYIPPEHHAAIEQALHYTERDWWDDDGPSQSIRAALAAMPKEE